MLSGADRVGLKDLDPVLVFLLVTVPVPRADW
jgi:hypothetical protein